uniref:Uncharacterized protein n=1 Tax=Phage sp. ctGns7 TaxID=2828003 RepID=A0A8S5S9N8_9VIRU|nr:MAG TPA: hypothetical protein [Phage sp. ctGns7]
MIFIHTLGYSTLATLFPISIIFNIFFHFSDFLLYLATPKK